MDPEKKRVVNDQNKVLCHNIKMNASTSLLDLSVKNPNQNNIVSKEEILDDVSMQLMLTGLQKASAAGLTSLQTRDMPNSPALLTNDPLVQANYIPSAENVPPTYRDQAIISPPPAPLPNKYPGDHSRGKNDEHYDEDYENELEYTQNPNMRKASRKNMISSYNLSQMRFASFDEVYESLQLPIVSGLLYFVFQMPIVRLQLNIFLPVLFNSEGGYNLQGLLFMSILYSLFIYLAERVF